MKRHAKILSALVLAAAPLLAATVLLFRPSLPDILLLAGLACGGVGAGFWLNRRQTASVDWSRHPATDTTSAPLPIEDSRLVDRIVLSLEEILWEIDRKSLPDRNLVVDKLHRHLDWLISRKEWKPTPGETREITVVLSDLRGFSMVTANYSAVQVVEMLNRYFSRMCEIIYRHGGTVDKFIGDSIMALFGAPASRGNDVLHAVGCAVEMQLAMNEFNHENEILGLPALHMGIGINTGPVIAGEIGSQLHSEYTVIGDEVNLVSRIEASTLRGQILVSESTYRLIAGQITVKSPIRVYVKGQRDPVNLYEVVEVGPPFNLVVPEREYRKHIRADVDIPFQFKVSVMKVVSTALYTGNIRNLSSGGMQVVTDVEVEALANIVFRLDYNLLGHESGDIYGKVLRVRREDDRFLMNVEFTAIEQKDSDAIDQLVTRVLDGSYGIVK